MTEQIGFGLLEKVGNGGGMSSGNGGILGFGMIDRLRKSVMMRVDNVKKSISNVKDTALTGKKWQPSDIVAEHVGGSREANQEMRPHVILE